MLMRQEQPKVSPDTSSQESGARGGTVKREVSSSTCGATPERADDEPPEDFIVTHCDWEECGRDYEHQADLVKVRARAGTLCVEPAQSGSDPPNNPVHCLVSQTARTQRYQLLVAAESWSKWRN